MPVQLMSKDDALRLLDRAVECRVKESVKTSSEGRKKVIKVKIRTKRYLHTLVFNDYDEGIAFAKTLKEKCKELGKELVIIDEQLKDKI